MLLLALHGSMGSGQQMRGFTGYRLERLADRYGFVVAYPDGFEGHWNDCRANAPYSANAENIEDVAFVLDLVRYFLEAHQVTPRVYAAGFSNGGHMAFRLALEEPEVTGAIVALAANLPVPEGNNCSAQPGAVPVMIVNGTEDPINPYHGGPVTIFGFGNRGNVLSSENSARFFAERAGMRGEPELSHLPALESGADETELDHFSWSRPGVTVELIRVNGGGHSIPQPEGRLPRILGVTSRQLDAPLALVQFFLYHHEQARTADVR